MTVLRHLRAPHLTRARIILMSALLFTAGMVIPASPASAAPTCENWQNKASWGNVWLCVEYRDTGQPAPWTWQPKHVYGQIKDRMTDGYCVSLYVERGKEDFNGVVTYAWAPNACSTSTAVNFDFTFALNGPTACGARLVKGTKSSWVNFSTAWNNPYFHCDDWPTS